MTNRWLKYLSAEDQAALAQWWQEQLAADPGESDIKPKRLRWWQRLWRQR